MKIFHFNQYTLTLAYYLLLTPFSTSKSDIRNLDRPQIWAFSSRKAVLTVQDMATFSKYLSDGTGDKYSCEETG